MAPRRGVIRAAVPFDRVHTYLCGPLKPAYDGSTYMIMFVDSASWWQWAYGIRAKSDTTNYIKHYLADISGMGTPECFRMDDGGNFTGQAFTEFFDAAGICREYAAPDTPTQIGVVDSAVCRAFKGGYVVCHHILSNPHVDLSAILNKDSDGHRMAVCLTGLPPRSTGGGFRPTRSLVGNHR